MKANDQKALTEDSGSGAESASDKTDPSLRRLLHEAARSPELSIGEGSPTGERTGSLPGALAAPSSWPDVEDYELLEALGHGGMGAVYKARQKRTGRLVAVKVILGRRGAHPEMLRRFEREIRILGQLRHPRIADIHAAGTTLDGDPFFAMELVQGVTLDRHQASQPALRERLELFRKICDAVAHLHRVGVIHRDLKPQNVMVCAEGTEVKVLDFGLARLDESDAETLTRQGLVQGTLPYMSPEQVNGEPLTTLSDVYALGVMLYELITERRPYDVSSQKLREAVRTICETRPDVPSAVKAGHPRKKDLDAIVLKALEKEPSRRYQSVAELSGDIENYMTNQPVLPRQIRFRVLRSLHHLGLFCRRNRAAVLIGSLACLGFLAGVVQQNRRELADKQEERGRQELLAGRMQQASVYLAEAARLGKDGPALRLQLGVANKALKAPAMTILEPVAEPASRTMSSEGKLVVTIGADFNARVWEVPSGKLRSTLDSGCERYPFEAFISPDGQSVVIACPEGPGTLWALEPPRDLASLGEGSRRYAGTLFSPDSNLVAYGGWKRASKSNFTTIVDRRSGETVVTLPGRPLEFSRDSTRLLLAQWDQATLADARTGQILLSLEGVSAPKLRGDGERIVTIGQGGAKLWDTASGQNLASLETDGEPVRGAEFSADGSRIVTVGLNTPVKLWDGDSGQLIQAFSGDQRIGDQAELSPDGSQILVAGAWGVNIFESSSGRLLDALQLRGERRLDAAFVLGGSHILSSRRGMTQLWRVGAEPWPIVVEQRFAGLRGLAFNPAGTRLLTLSAGGTARFWDTGSGELLATLEDPADRVAGLFPPRQLRHPFTLEEISEAANAWIESHRELLGSMGWDRLELSTLVGQGHIRTEIHQRALSNDSRPVLDSLGQPIACSPDTKLCATMGSGSMMQIYDPLSFQAVSSFTGLSGPIRTAAFSPEGMWIVTGSSRGTAEVWESSSGKLLLSLDAHPEAVISVAFSRDGTRIATGSQDGTVNIWDIRAEARDLDTVERLLRCRAPWRLEAGELVPAFPDPAACEPAAQR